MTLAFLTYGIACISLLRFRMVGIGTLFFFSIGFLLNMGAILFMLHGLDWKVFLSGHSILGYLSLTLMAIGTFGVWKGYICCRPGVRISKNLLRYIRFAYLWWVLTYLANIIMVIWR